MERVDSRKIQMSKWPNALIKNTFRRLVHNSEIQNMKLAWWKTTKKSVGKSETINIKKISNEEKAK